MLRNNLLAKLKVGRHWELNLHEKSGARIQVECQRHLAIKNIGFWMNLGYICENRSFADKKDINFALVPFSQIFTAAFGAFPHTLGAQGFLGFSRIVKKFGLKPVNFLKCSFGPPLIQNFSGLVRRTRRLRTLLAKTCG